MFNGAELITAESIRTPDAQYLTDNAYSYGEVQLLVAAVGG